MADFIAVIRRAVDGLSNNTPEMRAKVYDKARSAVLRQLENMNPRPPEQMLQRQLAKLDAAILEVEAEHAEALPDEEAAATFEEAMTPQPAIAQDWQEPAPEQAGEAAVEPERPVEAASEAWQAEAAPAEPDPWAAPAEPEQAAPEEAEPEDHAEAERRFEAEQVEPSPEFAEVAPELQPAPEPQPAHVFEPAPQEEPVRWAEEPVEAVEALAPAAFPAYSDADRDAVSTVEPEQGYAAPVTAEEPEEYRESQRAAEAQAEVLETEAETPAVEVAPTVPSYNRLVEIPVTGEDDWMPRRAADAGAEQDQATAPEPEAATVQPAAYEPWELPADASWRSEPARPADADALATPSDDVTGVKSEPAAPGTLDALDWDSTAYALPSAGAKDGPSTDMPVASDDFSDWFADYDKPKETAADEGAAAVVPVADTVIRPQPVTADAAPASSSVEDVDAFLAETQQRAYRIEPKERRNYAPVVLGLLGVALVAGGGFAAWTYRDQITQYVSGLTDTAPATVTEQPAPEAGTGAETATGTPAPAAETGQPTNGAADDGSVAGQKFTQRLMPDGTEVDEGAGTTAAGGPSSEGKSVSEQNVASTVEPTDQPAVGTNAGVAQPATPTTTAPSTGDSVAPAANGERAFLYEERLGQTTPTAVPGTIAWSALRETGEDGKPNPEIQGKITIPDRGLTALITIKRNTDSSLPASHLIEVVFSVPPDFEGGAVDKLERIAMKRTEQDRGDPLVAVAAKVTDDTYLVALNDFEDIMKANLDLLATRGWIDIPISYRNGRRALLTLDKGAAGAAVFDQVMKEWTALGGPGN